MAKKWKDITHKREEDSMNPEENEGVGEGREAESDNYMDEVQDEVQEGNSDAMGILRDQTGLGQTPDQEGEQVKEEETTEPGVEVDTSAIDEQYTAPEPQQVESNTVIYVPRKDFTGRVNQDEYEFTKGVPVEVTHDVANMLLEDEDRGYVRD